MLALVPPRIGISCILKAINKISPVPRYKKGAPYLLYKRKKKDWEEGEWMKKKNGGEKCELKILKRRKIKKRERKMNIE